MCNVAVTLMTFDMRSNGRRFRSRMVVVTTPRCVVQEVGMSEVLLRRYCP